MSYQGSHVALCENESKCNGLEIPREYLGDFEEWNWYHNEGGAFQSKDDESFEAKGIDTLAKPFEEIGIPKTYARLGVITAGITALAFGVMKLKDR